MKFDNLEKLTNWKINLCTSGMFHPDPNKFNEIVWNAMEQSSQCIT